MSQIIDAVNAHSGYAGPLQLASGLDLQGNKISNVGPAESENDVVTSIVAEKRYSAAALRPQLESSGTHPFVSYRQINNQGQREATSSWLNNLLSTPPNSNNINPIITPGSGTTTVTIPASIIQMADGTKRYLPSRTDTLTNPASYSISTFTVASGIATVNLTSTPVPPFTSSTVVFISGTGQIDGTFPIASILGPMQFTINVTSGVSGSGGSVSTGGSFYYFLNRSFNKVMLATFPSSSDTPFNRLGVSADGFQLLAVVAINSSGYVSVGSAGGGTPTLTTTANAGSRF
jgi:hypothetical protein